MPKVRIVLEAEIGDLKSYWPNRPNGITQENIGHFLMELSMHPIEQLMKTCADEKSIKKQKGGKAIYKALMRTYEEDRKLGKRLLTKYRVEIIEGKKNERDPKKGK